MSDPEVTPAPAGQPRCPQCGTALPTGALAGLCPACLLAAGAAADTVTDAKQPHFTPPSIADLAPLFPQLDILELIGKGGMGAVYKARQKQLDRFVALKILPPGIGDDPAFAERFAREAKALAKLNHPGIVTLYEFGNVERPDAAHPAPHASRLFYFLMEYVDGVNLRQLLHTGRVSAREALAIVPQICDALQFAHDQGIVHRDIKPENILLDRRGRVKVADFGLAKIIEPGRPDQPAGHGAGSAPPTGPTSVMGTPQYMSPEQITAPGEVDHRADIYALGVVFYQMLTGELPGKNIELPSRKVHVDVRLDEIVLRALEKNPELRYQHVSEVKTMVETIVATPPGGDQAGESQAGSNAGRKVSRRNGLRRATLVGLAVGLVALVAAVIITFKMPDVYMAKAVIKWDRLVPAGTNFFQLPTSEDAPQEIQTQAAVIQSDAVLDKVMADLNLGGRWGRELEVSKAMEFLKRQLFVNPPRNGAKLIEIWFFDHDPHEAAEIANAIAQGYADLCQKQVDAFNARSVETGSPGKLEVPGEPQVYQVEILERAQPPLHPIRPKRALNLFFGAVFAGVLGFLAGVVSLVWFRVSDGSSLAGVSPFPWRPVSGAGGSPAQNWAGMCAAGLDFRTSVAIFGLPLVHVATGRDPATGRQRIARGFIAIGDVAQGVVAFGGIAMGGITFGGLSLGIFAFGGVAFGLVALGGVALALVAALGGVAVAPIALGGTAFGVFAHGGGIGAHLLDTAPGGTATSQFFLSWAKTFLANFQPIVFAFAALTVLVMVGVPLWLQWRKAGKAGAEKVLPAVESWLAVMDAGNYAQSWELAAPYFQRVMGREEWVGKGQKIRYPLGGVYSRKLTSTRFSGAGTRLEAKFSTSFDGLVAAVETVTFTLQPAGRWQAIGYLIRPKGYEFKRRLKRFFIVKLPLALVAALIVRTFFLHSFVVMTDAAAPEIPRGSHFLVWKLARNFVPGDLIAYQQEGYANVGRVVSNADGFVVVSRNGQGNTTVPRGDILGRVVSIYWRGRSDEAEVRAPKSEVGPRMAAYKTTLTNGMEVEVVGIARNPRNNQSVWWKPDGTVFAGRPVELLHFPARPAGYAVANGLEEHEFVVYVHWPAQQPATKWPARTTYHFDPRPDMIEPGLVVQEPALTNGPGQGVSIGDILVYTNPPAAVDYSFAAAADNWERVATFDSVKTHEVMPGVEVTCETPTFDEKRGDNEFQLMHNIDPEEYTLRVIAMLKNGSESEVSMVGNYGPAAGGSHKELVFLTDLRTKRNIEPSEVKEYAIERSRWIRGEIKGIPLSHLIK